MGDFGYPVRRVPFTHYKFTQPVNPLNGLGNRGKVTIYRVISCADEYSNWQLGILAAHRDFETRDIQTPLRLRCTCDESVFFPPTTIVTHCRALVKNQAQDTRRKNTNSVASYDVFSGIWGSLGFCNSVYLAMAIWFQVWSVGLQVCAHGYTQVQISRSGTILYPIIYNKYL
ncbi:hypothetical protein B0H14DRAFT_3133259 [Mycena olivaceomarginata]|nr:hypothetical protein B0H14DRAFT_3133259 [Mycena olivaceomarginata]